MPSEFRPSATFRSEQLEAKCVLAKMQRFAHVAEAGEAAESERLRGQFADCYRSVIGVHPSRRHELRAAMERVIAGGRMPVEDVLESLARDYSRNTRPALEADESVLP